MVAHNAHNHWVSQNNRVFSGLHVCYNPVTLQSIWEIPVKIFER
jgi:hypothetical protein